ncbi:MAG: hypothetical protein GF416_04485 [Candidatus Altiarchaeales archaeon]|nr:hypothetical protein [Candidatus Altiarchaeales archaeon]MBD3416377.1 hypothetical protein [Candidatus Altiarchaeales archaeon]
MKDSMRLCDSLYRMGGGRGRPCRGDRNAARIQGEMHRIMCSIIFKS